MRGNQVAPRNIDEYIAGFPEDVQERLQEVRRTIREAVPAAEETISYQMPAFRLRGKILVYFAGHTNHIGFYPAPRTIEEFREELSAYKGGKGTVQFPFGQALPRDLIRRMVQFKAGELSR